MEVGKNQRVCKTCQQTFWIRPRWGAPPAYCSAACRLEAERQQLQAYRQRNLEKVRERDRLRHQQQRQKRRQPPQQRTCPNCQRLFLSQSRGGRPPRYCGPACSYEAQLHRARTCRKKKYAANNPKERPYEKEAI